MHVPAPDAPKDSKFYTPSNLVAQRLAGDDGDLLAHPFVGVEVTAQAGVILLDDDPGGLLHCLGPDSSLRRNQAISMWGGRHIECTMDCWSGKVCLR